MLGPKAATPAQHLTKMAAAAAVMETPTKEHAWSIYDGRWEVHKFGGASLETAELYRTCGELLRAESARTGSVVPTAAVVSATGGMTDALISVVSAAERDPEEASSMLKAALDRQKGLVLELAPGRPDLADPVCANLDRDSQGVEAMITAVSAMRLAPPQMLELVAGLGEVWSAQTLSCYLQATGEQADWVDARDVLVVPELSAAGVGEKGTAVDIIEPLWDESTSKLEVWWEKHFGQPARGARAPFIVFTGFVCSTLAGRPTTLKRSGSDYSATILAKMMDASRVTMWKNTNGIYTADPRRVPEAFSVETMTFDEAMELAYFGGQVLHPLAMVPCMEKRIPVYVRNFLNPGHRGTRVYGRGDKWLRWPDQEEEERMPVTAVSSIEKVALVTVSGASFLGTHGVAKRLMGSLARAQVNVILTSMGSSEHSITVALLEDEGEAGLSAVKEAFAIEMAKDSEIRVMYRPGCSILAVIGEGMKMQAGIAGNFFKALGSAAVNVVAIAQGSSERNISVVVLRDELSRALRAVHDGFTLSSVTLGVGIVGSNDCAEELLNQIANFQGDMEVPAGTNTPAVLARAKRLKIQVTAICNRKQMLLAEHGLPLAGLKGKIPNPCTPETLKKMLVDSGAADASELLLVDTDLAAMEDFIDMKRIPHKVLIDCTASENVAGLTAEWLKRGIHVLSANRLSAAGPADLYKECQAATRNSPVHWKYESTVGAQMPVISILHDIMQTGDRVTSVGGPISGSLAYIFDRLTQNPEVRLSEALAEAYEEGLTETNPCIDLSGVDTAHKAVIIGRELGFDVELADVEVESLLPETVSAEVREAADSPEAVQALCAALREGGGDTAMAERLAGAAAKRECVRYVFEVDTVSGTMKAGLRSFPLESGLASLRGNEVRIEFFTEKHNAEIPLIVRCPGAGAVVTASGLFNDIMRLSRQLGN